MGDNRVSSLPEFVSAVLDYGNRWAKPDSEPEIWCRGVSDHRIHLLPGAYWRKNCEEESLFLSFQALVPSYIQQLPNDDWEWYYLMQHHRLPTRLLDWSESPLVALYFALTNAQGDSLVPAAGALPCVWLMDPGVLNRVTHRLNEEFIFVPGQPQLEYWLPRFCGRGKMALKLPQKSDFTDNSKPIAIFPKRHNPRIVAQRGVFTVHGSDEVSIEEVLRADSPPAEETRLAQVLIDPGKCETLLRDLRTLGLNQSTLFPEPDSVSKDLMRIYNVRP